MPSELEHRWVRCDCVCIVNQKFASGYFGIPHTTWEFEVQNDTGRIGYGETGLLEDAIKECNRLAVQYYHKLRS